VDRLLVVPDFFPEAGEMRASFDERFGTPRHATRVRFIWDYFHIPGQYTYLRTFAEYAFPPEVYNRFLKHLRRWGRDHLGCDRVMNPWLSFFVNDCFQELHTDVPQGPWAYVFSLTDWDHRSFTGGETILLAKDCLDYWRHFEASDSRELSSLVELVPPGFNQLTVFDPRIPHGVRRVQGVWSPLKSRLVLHGWFLKPSRILSEGLENHVSPAQLDAALLPLHTALRTFETVSGLVTARVELSSAGRTAGLTVLANTLVSTAGERAQPEAVLDVIVRYLQELSFSSTPPEAWMILPFQLPLG
jgi:hypothetical protein